jgi:hypothetical protein
MIKNKNTIIISHRGYENGEDQKLENNPTQIQKMLKNNIQVEIDVYYYKENFFLGHDEPKYQINIDFLKQKGLWCHAKNLDSLKTMLKNNIHCFWHQEDDYTLTSKGYIWTYPNKQLTDSSICVLNSIILKQIPDCFAICTDYPLYYKNLEN